MVIWLLEVVPVVDDVPLVDELVPVVPLVLDVDASALLMVIVPEQSTFTV